MAKYYQNAYFIRSRIVHFVKNMFPIYRIMERFEPEFTLYEKEQQLCKINNFKKFADYRCHLASVGEESNLSILYRAQELNRLQMTAERILHLEKMKTDSVQKL